ncbi:hypothetical protein BH09BAC4_BH09BAC4_38980 [soil metagenome]
MVGDTYFPNCKGKVGLAWPLYWQKTSARPSRMYSCVGSILHALLISLSAGFLKPVPIPYADSVSN